MDLHVYRNSQDRWHDLKSSAREGGAILAINAVTLNELIEKLTPDARVATVGERMFPEFCRPSSPNSPLIERLFVFDKPHEPLDSLASLRVIQAPGRYREIEWIGSEISQLLARKANASEIAVVVRNIET